MNYAALIAAGRAAWPKVEVAAGALRKQLHRAGIAEEPGPHAGDVFLAAACLAGSRTALEAFVSRPLARALGRVRPDLRADVGQAVCERLLGSDPPALLKYSGVSSLERWLRRTVENAATDFARSQRQHAGLDEWLTGILSSPEGRIVEAVSRAPVQKIVRDVLAALQPEERELLAMFHRQELPHARIGEKLALPRSTVAHRLKRLHEKLSRLIRERVRAELRLATGDVEDALRLLRGEWSSPLGF